ncbi:hypothetical protein P153DRAFT_380951 [Dothidotthia symphoricarpi CBS 119687]|uniref:MARVEL domain-containing protein n=1 Tax=Dothidotthia symphoricarpi CBS 119687 TaxID=1392245 RepID=A0A6A6APQ1_9PLEO|nr:uncharacterized protein P153DRAFT_380951 [Dothidotthia symphoricarpi CBS 119687]KAF2133770.1 hypothetical protein P153DRAFT_380951 [Dothidotthia symphoricarpi CBS 119687]
MPNPNGCRVFLLLIPPLFSLFPVAAITLILERISSNLLRDQTTRNLRDGAYELHLNRPTSTGSNNTSIDVTLLTKQAPTFALLSVCTLAYVASALGVLGIWDLKRVEGTMQHQRAWSWTVITSNLVMFGASLGVFGYLSSVQNSEKDWKSYEDAAQDGQRLTEETWSCQINKFFPDESWAGNACTTAKATRFCLIGIAISSLLVIVSASILIRSRGGIKWLLGGKGRYAGFESVYELRPTGYQTPYIVQYAPQPILQPGYQAAYTNATANQQMNSR